MLSSVSSVISGAGAELVLGGHGTMMTIVPMLLGCCTCTGPVYRWGACTGVLYTASGPAPSPGNTSAGGTLAHVPSGHQWSWPHPPRVTRHSVQPAAAETV